MINKIGERWTQMTKYERIWKLVQFVEKLIETDYPNSELQWPFMGILIEATLMWAWCLVYWQEQQIQTSIQIKLVFINTQG